ncbi:MAG TPA: ABC transporter ATP-binding protein, partial [Azospira sp.]|nr:ABC transporter ATP-binding protein [Azospira sp.]
DRHLLRTTADTLLLVADGKAAPFDGDLDDYAGWLAAQREAAKAPATEVAADKAARKEAREQAAADRQALLARRRPLLKESEQLEKKIAAWQGEKAELDSLLADPAAYTTPDRAGLEAKLKRQAELAAAIDGAEERWLEVHSELETLA